MPSVPTISNVVPGAHVNIVLKADQPTGRTVSGTVSELLTRGNHPRGIKVRLTDGRVGRVQSMAGSAAPGVSPAQFDINTETSIDSLPTPPAYGGRGQYHDIRTEPQPTQQVGLEAYIKPAKKRGRGKAKNTRGAASETATGTDSVGVFEDAVDRSAPGSEETACPVCGDFTGDVAALTHHVQSHFKD
jgi:uncharacterized repeat protein (TIGR03833 family)